ncbi:rhomboid family intramembrane serine protease [uncultured Aquimarina sp.]|uniref:rhomboid family intramembrane serine protease n=1 Tax=uncultured Aquimarina sp. TaxID=575652 RepID=UPI0026093B0A|nr:rhomboid family intramembrane serine protease [uncultured Aquimarina sp.]
MERSNHFKFSTGVIGYPILFVLAIWITFWFEIRFGFDFNHFGIYPRTLTGLRGVFFSPFIHGDLAHLWHNTLPLLILSMALFFFYPKNSWKVLFLGVLFTGGMTWLLGRPANHIGASGIIYMLFGFLFFKGIIAKHFRLIALSFVVVFIYGSMIWYTLPVDPKISWEGHLSGLIVGVLLAFLIKKGIAKPKTYYWESSDYNPDDDEFLKHFDENGNFIEKLPEEEGDIEIVYEYKSKDDSSKENY